MSSPYDISRMTGTVYSRLVREAPGVLLPLASQEILGQHGPLGADFIVSNHVTPLIAEKTCCPFAQAIPYGDTLELDGWTGTVHVDSRILEGYYQEVARSFLIGGGAPAVVFIAYHSLNLKAVDAVCRKLNHEGHTVLAIDWWRAAGQCGHKWLKDQEHGLGHGAELTTSVLMAIEESLFEQPNPPGELPMDGLSHALKYQFTRGDAFQAYGSFKEYCTTGAWGDLSGATKETGLAVINDAVDFISGVILEALSYRR